MSHIRKIIAGRFRSIGLVPSIPPVAGCVGHEGPVEWFDSSYVEDKSFLFCDDYLAGLLEKSVLVPVSSTMNLRCSTAW